MALPHCGFSAGVSAGLWAQPQRHEVVTTWCTGRHHGYAALNVYTFQVVGSPNGEAGAGKGACGG
jgi:hypothetical protein